MTAVIGTNREFVFNLKNLNDSSDEVMGKISEADSIIQDCGLKASVDNNGIGSYEFWGHRGNDKGTDYLTLDECESFNLKYVFEEGIPEGTVLKSLEEQLLGDYHRTRTHSQGGDERSDGLDIDLILMATNAKIEGNTFSCTVTWKASNL